MKKTALTFFLLLAGAARAQSPAPVGGGNYATPAVECVSPAQRLRIDSMLTANVQQLRGRGVLPPATQRTTSVPLSWPLRQATGFAYNSIYSVNYFVDDDPRYPGYVLDWNCGTRAKDFSGGNHAGTDIVLWPFGWNMMAANQGRL